MNLQSEFPASSIALYEANKSQCKIALSPSFMPNEKFYLNIATYKETSDEIAFIPNLDHYTIFATDEGSWNSVYFTCNKRNALLFQPEDRFVYKDLISRYNIQKFHIGMYLENDIWKNVKGTEVKEFFWGRNEPSHPKYELCGGANQNIEMVDINCDNKIRIGLCIY